MTRERVTLESYKLGGGYMVRRLKSEVLKELPAKLRQVIELPSEGLKEVIDAEWKAFHKCEDFMRSLRVAYELAKASDTDSEYHGAVDALRKGQTACFAEMALMRLSVAKQKLPYVIQHLKDCVSEEHKAICFAWHRDIVDAIAQAFPDNCVTMTGDTPVHIRQDVVKAFQENRDVHLFIGNMKAAGVGITLTASSHVVFAELEWVPANISQAEDRAHRIGQTDSVLCQHLVLEGSLDATMAKRIIQKQKTITKALDAEIVEEQLDFTTEEASTSTVTRKEIITKCLTLTQEQTFVIHTALKHISALCNHARSLDGMGFSKLDADIGHSLASSYSLSQRQAYVGLKLATRHRKQLPDSMREEIERMNT
jgi:SNF2 family DNA or RNA helicase